jgi:hypothetical protein
MPHDYSYPIMVDLEVYWAFSQSRAPNIQIYGLTYMLLLCNQKKFFCYFVKIYTPLVGHACFKFTFYWFFFLFLYYILWFFFFAIEMSIFLWRVSWSGFKSWSLHFVCLSFNWLIISIIYKKNWLSRISQIDKQFLCVYIKKKIQNNQTMKFLGLAFS